MGDLLLSVDDISFTEEYTEAKLEKMIEIYDKMEKVPIKVNRGGKILRLQIKAQVDCQD